MQPVLAAVGGPNPTGPWPNRLLLTREEIGQLGGAPKRIAELRSLEALATTGPSGHNQ